MTVSWPISAFDRQLEDWMTVSWVMPAFASQQSDSMMTRSANSVLFTSTVNICSALLYFLAEISVRSPRKLFIVIN